MVKYEIWNIRFELWDTEYDKEYGNKEYDILGRSTLHACVSDQGGSRKEEHGGRRHDKTNKAEKEKWAN